VAVALVRTFQPAVAPRFWTAVEPVDGSVKVARAALDAALDVPAARGRLWGSAPAVAIWTVPARTALTSAAAPKVRIDFLDLIPGSS
jgi:hypothetical protein